MKRRRVGVLSVAAVAAAALMLAVGPAAAMGPAPTSAPWNTAAATPAQCAPTRDTPRNEAKAASPATHDMAGMAGMAGMVGKDHSPTPHPMKDLTDRLARTPSGGTLKVPPGVYRGALVIDRPVKLVGIGHPILQGGGKGTVLTIRAAGTTVRDLMVEGSGPGPVGNPAGVSVEADRVVVKDLHISDTYTGIWVEGVSDVQITDNVIEGRKQVSVAGVTAAPMSGDMAGMVMESGKASGTGHAKAERGDGVSLFNAIRPVVAGNDISNVRDGIYVSYGSHPRIECNSVADSRYAIHGMYGKAVTVAQNRFIANQSGPVMMYGGPITVEGNLIRDQQSAATGFGVLLLDVGGARLLRNVLVSNRVGLQIEGSAGGLSPTAVELNTIALNQIGVGLYPSAEASLSENSFVENTVQVLGLGPDGGGGDSRWSSARAGNFWSDYRGFERSSPSAGQSGVGQIPHIEGAAAGRLLAGDPTLLALASSPAFTLLRAVEQRSAGQHPVVVDRLPLISPRSPALPPAAAHAALGTGVVGAASLVLCSLVLLRSTKRRQLSSGRKSP